MAGKGVYTYNLCTVINRFSIRTFYKVQTKSFIKENTMDVELMELMESEEGSLVVDWMDCEHLEDGLIRSTGCTRNNGQCKDCQHSKFGAASWCDGCNFVTYKTEVDKPIHLEFGW